MTLVMPDHFGDDEAQEFLGELGIEVLPFYALKTVYSAR
jgi:hypothetical protein